MKRGLIFLAVLLLGTQVVFVSSQETVPESLRNNQFYTESLRLNNAAKTAFSDGDYEASAQYSEEAIRYAALSDDYVAMRLRTVEVDRIINTARQRLDYASSINAAEKFPDEYNSALTAFNEARRFYAVANWQNTIDAANRVLTALATIDGGTVATGGTPGAVVTPPGVTPTPTPGGQTALPAQYTVRTWEAVRDCLWNIAGRSYVYNDPTRWRVIYEANKSKLPDPNNPDLIEPGIVLTIPSVRGETRQGTWEAGRGYPSF